jgi:hypothetical protein
VSLAPAGVGAVVYSNFSGVHQDYAEDNLQLGPASSPEYNRTNVPGSVSTHHTPRQNGTSIPGQPSGVAGNLTPNFDLIDSSLQRANEFISTIKRRIAAGTETASTSS